MIELIFHFGGESIFVRIDGKIILFGNSSQGGILAPIQGLKLSRPGVMKEFPDLEGDPEWQSKANKRFKEYIQSLPTEKARSDYIINDLQKHGYTPYLRQVAGFRPERLNGDLK